MSTFSRINGVSITAYWGRFGLLSFVGLFLSIFFTSRAQAQGGLGNSPYSAIGLGETFSGAFSTQQMMGGAGVAASNGIYINNLNPALLARSRNVTFEVGILGQYKKLRENTLQQTTTGGNLNYLALGFPVNRRWTASISLLPYSYVNYELAEARQVPGSSYLGSYGYSGSGGLNRVAVTNGFQIGKSLFVGASLSYMFGGIEQESSSVLAIPNGSFYQLSLRNRINYHDFMLKLGIAWRQKLKEKLYVTAGGTVDFGTYMRADRLRSYQVLGANGLVVPGSLSDTLDLNQNGSVRLAPAYRVGIAIENPYKLTLAVDATYQQWSKFRSFTNTGGNVNERLADSYGIAVGAEYTPNILATSGYWNRVPYRVGFNYGLTPYVVNNKQTSEWNVTAGLSLPLSRSGLSDLNLGFQYGERGTNGTGLIREQYGRVILGFTLNDRWFQRLVID